MTSTGSFKSTSEKRRNASEECSHPPFTSQFQCAEGEGDLLELEEELIFQDREVQVPQTGR